MKAHLIDIHFLVPRSRSSAKVKVKYQGHVSQKIGVSGGSSVSQTHLVAFDFDGEEKVRKEKKKRSFLSFF